MSFVKSFFYSAMLKCQVNIMLLCKVLYKFLRLAMGQGGVVGVVGVVGVAAMLYCYNRQRREKLEMIKCGGDANKGKS